MNKYNEKQLEDVNNQITRIKEYSDKLKNLVSTERDVFWGGLNKIIDKSIEGHKSKIVDILSQNTVDHPGITLGVVRFHAGCIQAYKEIVNIVVKNDDACGEAGSRLKELTDKAREIRDNIDNQ